MLSLKELALAGIKTSKKVNISEEIPKNNTPQQAQSYNNKEHFQKISDNEKNSNALFLAKSNLQFEEMFTADFNEYNEVSQLNLDRDFITLDVLLKRPILEIPFLLEKLLPEKSIVFLAGDSDSGKSLFYSQLAIAIITGKDNFLGLKLNTKNKGVIAVNSEDNLDAITVRVKKQLHGEKLQDEIARRMNITTTGDDIIKLLSKKLKETPVDLIVIDAFGDVFEDDMNSSNAVRKFLDQFSDLCQTYSCTVLFIHHIGKGKESLLANKGHMLGSVGTHGKARNVIMLSKQPNNPNLKALKIVKGNYVSEEDKKNEILLVFDPVTLLHRVADDETLKEVNETQQKQSDYPKSKKQSKVFLLKQDAWKLKEAGNTLEVIGKLLGRDKSTISKWLKTYEPLYDVSKAISKPL